MTFSVLTSAKYRRPAGVDRAWPVKGLVLGLGLACSMPALAMQELEETDLREATGEGIAIVLTDFALKYGPTSYFELTGTNEAAGTELNHRRGDLRWYGMSYTSGNRAVATAGQAWSGPCSNGILNLGCPLGGTIKNLAPHDNPLVLRAFDYTGTTMTGTTNVSRSVLELVFPTKHERYRFSFWGEMNVGTGSTVGTGNTMGSTIGDGTDKLQMQNIWSNIDQSGTVVRLFQTSTGSNDTLGMQYINRFSADIRMSVAQRITSPDTLGQTPEFDDREGLYMGDYRVFMPLGALHYKAMVVDDVAASGAGSGNFQIKINALPNIAAVYNEYYGRTIVTDPTGGYDRTKIGLSNTAYHATHGFVRMGDWAADHRPNVNVNISLGASDPCIAAETCYYYNPPAFGAQDAPIGGSGRLMASEKAAGACMQDRPSCTNGKNTPYSTSDGIFFVAAPGERFAVFAVSPNWMSDGGSGNQNNQDPLDPDLNDNNIIGGVAVDGGDGSPGGNTFSNRTIANGGIVNLSTINLGDTNIQGMLVHSMSLKTLGAN